MYTSAVKGDRTTLVEREAELGRLGGELVARPKAEALGQVAGVFGFDRKRIEMAATVLEPFAYSLLLELTAIVAFTFGFAGNRGQDRPAVTVAPIESAATEVAATVATIAPPVMIVEQPLPALVVASATVANRPDSTPPRGGNRRRKLPERRVATRAAAEADVIRLVARGERLPSQDVLARRWGCHKGTASKWLASFEARGLVVRTVAGRSKQVAAALHVVA